jgi:hypothetical protein
MRGIVFTDTPPGIDRQLIRSLPGQDSFPVQIKLVHVHVHVRDKTDTLHCS